MFGHHKSPQYQHVGFSTVGAHCDVYPVWLLAVRGFIRHGRLHSAYM